MGELKYKIETTRSYLNFLLSKSNSMIDPYVVFVSQELDKLLNMYYAL